MTKPCDRPVALVDLDGTITEHIDWQPELGVFGAVKEIARQTIKEMKADGWEIIVFTSRHWIERDYIMNFLIDNDVPVDSVLCGKPLGTIYIDDKAVGHQANWDTVRSHLNMQDSDLGFC